MSYEIELTREFLSSVLPTGRMCTAGEVWRGQSLIVWATAEGRSAARGLDLYHMGHSDLL